MHVDQCGVEPAEGSRDYTDTIADTIMNVFGAAVTVSSRCNR